MDTEQTLFYKCLTHKCCYADGKRVCINKIADTIDVRDTECEYEQKICLVLNNMI
jgi:hypothetical protein